MKKLILILFFVAVSYAGQAFSQGYKAGWSAGHCYGKGYGCYPRFAPFPPFPPFGEDTFMGGYNIGFLDGLAAQ